MAIEVFEIATRIDLKSNAIKVIEDLAKQFETLDKLTKDVQSSLGRVAAELKRLGEGNTELKGLGRSVGSIAKAFDTVGKSSTEAAAGIEKIADSTRDAVSAGRRLGRIYTENADLARAAARATAGSGKSATEAAAVASRRSGASHGLGFGHQLMDAGIGAQMAGEPLVHLGTEAIRQAFDAGHVMSILQADQRVGKAEAQAAMTAAVKATQSAPGTTVTQNLEGLLDLKNVLGSFQEAMAALPGFANLSTVLRMADLKHGGSGDPVYAAAKAMDLLGEMVEEHTDAKGHTTREINPQRMNDRLSDLSRVSVATQGRVNPEEYLKFARMGEVAGMQMTDEFKYQLLPAMILAQGGSRVGTEFQSLNQVFQGNRLMPKYADALIGVGLASDEGYEKTTNRRTHKKQTVFNETKGVFDLDLLAKNPFEWMLKSQQRMEGANIHGTDAQIKALQTVSQRSTIARLLVLMLKDQLGIQREQQNIQNTNTGDPGVMPVRGGFARSGAPISAVLKSPEQSLAELQAAWKNLMQAVGTPAMGDAVSMLNKLTGALHQLEDLARANPEWARTVVKAVGEVGVALVGAGGLTMALWALSGPVKAATALIGGLRVAAEALGLLKIAGAPGGGGGIPPVAPITTKNPLQKSMTGLGLPLLDTPAAIALPLLAGGAAAGYMNAPMVDPITGAVIGNWGGAEGEKNWAESQKRAVQQFKETDSTSRLSTHVGATDATGKAASSVFSMPNAIHQILGGWSPAAAGDISAVGTTIGDKSADAVKDKLDPHVIGTEIGNIAAATLRSALGSLSINVDGQQFGRIVDRSRDQQATRPPTGTSVVDMRHNPLYPAYAY